MKALFTLLVLLLSLFTSQIFSDKNPANISSPMLITRTQVSLEANDMRSWIWNSGIFDQDLRTNNTPGCEWPKNSGKCVIFTTGLTMGAYVNNQLRLTACSYLGEMVPGYCVNDVFQTNPAFKLYKVTRGDNQITNPDWANWGLMVPYGAPFKDVNNNGTYEPAIDVPGVNGAAQTIFVCLTDADATAHTNVEGFSGGTDPLNNEMHFTAWCYDNSGFENIQFFKWVVVNKNTAAWDSTLFSLVSDPDIGDATDDYIGCDTNLSLGFCYNGDNQDGTGSGNSYGANPPSAGLIFLNGSGSNARLSSFGFFTNTSSPGPVCERDPSTVNEAYWFMKGYKKDGTQWININTMQPTRYTYPYPGWNESMGRIENCGGATGGSIVASTPGDRRFVMSYKPANQRLNPGDSVVFIGAQLVARGNSNLNSITQLQNTAVDARTLCQNGFVIGLNQISTEVPKSFNLSQNYPNPFNPSTKINFSLPKEQNVIIKVYDAIGREVAVLINEKINAGTYSVDWNAADYPSGVYFYRMTTDGFSQTKKMLLVK